MYEAFYGLRERPFDLGSNLRFLVLAAPHRETLAALRHGLAAGKPLTVLTGEPGTGKTMLVRAAIADLDASDRCLLVTNPRITRAELVGRIERALAAGGDRREPTVVVIDEAQDASDRLLDEIRLLTNLEAAEAGRLSIVLVGQPALLTRLQRPELQRLKQRVALWCTVRPLTLIETAGYLAARIRTAGGDAGTVLTREAVQAIHDSASGIPRVISVLADNALRSGCAANERPIAAPLIASVCRDCHIAPVEVPA